MQPSVRKNFIYRTCYEVLLIITPFITEPYIARVLGADGVGIASYTNSIMMFFTMFAALGTVGYGTREIALHRDDRKEASKLFWEIELLTVFTSSICLVIWLALCFLYKQYTPYLIALIPTLLSTMLDINWFYTGYEKIIFTVLRNSFVRILGIIALFTFVKTRDDVVLYIFINSFAMFLGSLSMWTYMPRMLEKVKISELNVFRHFKQTLIYFVPTIATSIYTILDKILIGLITADPTQNGNYEQATKVINLIKTMVFTSVNMVMGARISYLFSQEKYDEIKRRIRRSMDFILLVGVGCAMGAAAVAGVFVPLFFGKEFMPAILLVRMMAPLIILIGISNCLGNQYYTPSGQRARSAKVIVAGALMNLCFNLVLIPGLGAKGAVAASVIAEALIMILYVRMSAGYMTFQIIWSDLWKRLIAGVLMCAVIFAIEKTGLLRPVIRLILMILSGILVYGCSLCIMRDQMTLELLGIITGTIRRYFFRKGRDQ